MKTESAGKVGVILAIGWLTGCSVVNSSQVDQSTVYQSYEARFDEADTKVHLEARYFVGGGTGTMLILDGTSQVAADGVEMDYDRSIFNEIIYKRDLSRPSDLSRAWTFVYTNNDGRRFANSIRIPPAVAFGSGAGDPAIIGRPYVLRWTAAQSSFAYVVGYITGQQGSIQRNDPHSTSSLSGEVVFSESDVRILGQGSAKAKLCRETNGSGLSDATAAGGTIRGQYCTAIRTINVQ